MPSVTLLLEKTPPEDFVGWLERFTQNVHLEHVFPTDNGYLKIYKAQRAYRLNIPMFWIMPVEYQAKQKDFVEDLGGGIEFEIYKLGENLDVIANCRQPVLRNYFMILLWEIAKKWKGVNQEVDNFKVEIYGEELPDFLSGVSPDFRQWLIGSSRIDNSSAGNKKSEVSQPTTQIQLKPTGRPAIASYDKAFNLVASGAMSLDDAYVEYIKDAGIKNAGEAERRAFNEAMKRRNKKVTKGHKSDFF